MKIILDELTKTFGNTVAVKDFSVLFESGRLTALLGPSGCGKSTLLYMIAGIMPVTHGKIFFDDLDVTDVQPEKRGVGLVFQNYALYPHMNVLQNICFPLEIQKVPKAERLMRANEMAKLVHIDELMNRKPSELSGGQQQRVAITRALVKKPRVLLLDEPLSNLDARLRIEMREEIRRIQQETGVTTIFVTHDQEEAMSIADDILLMRLGEQQQYAEPQELYDNPANLFVSEFLGNPPINKICGLIKDKKFFLNDFSASFILPVFANINEGTRVTLAIRPESIFITSDQDKKVFSVIITQVYRIGKEELTHLQIGSCNIRGFISSENDLVVNDIISVGLKAKGVFLFNTDTGQRIT